MDDGGVDDRGVDDGGVDVSGEGVLVEERCSGDEKSRDFARDDEWDDGLFFSGSIDPGIGEIASDPFPD